MRLRRGLSAEDQRAAFRDDLVEYYRECNRKNIEELDSLSQLYRACHDGYDELHASRAEWIRAFNRLEKAVTNHIRDCIDSDALAHAHKAVMKDIGPPASPRGHEIIDTLRQEWP
jgi:hypothetical protein